MNRFIFPVRIPPGGRNSSRTIRNALIDEVYRDPRGSSGYILVWQRSPLQGLILPAAQRLRINVSRRTRIQTRNGRRLTLDNLRRGMRIDAVISAIETRSLPPQVSASEITVLTEAPAMATTTDRITEVNVGGSYIMTGNPRNAEEQIRFNVTSDTIIRDENGRRIRLADLRPGQLVRIEHANFMTLSIPPQTPALSIQVIRNIPSR